MKTELFCRVSALFGIVGVVLLIISFVINPGPGPHPTAAQLTSFIGQHHASVLLGSWLQAVSPALIVIFALGLVHLAGDSARFEGQITQVGTVILVMVSLIEVTFYICAAKGDPATTGLISLELIRSTQHLFSMVAAPIVFLPLSGVILRSRVLPRAFGYTGLALGLLFAAMGALVLFWPWQYLVDYLSYIQGVWWLAAAITLLLYPPQPSFVGVSPVSRSRA
jgi:hypothetical protein